MIIPTLRHAWKELLISPSNDSTNQITPTNQIARVIPCAATVYVCAIECNGIRKQTRYVSMYIHVIHHDNKFSRVEYS